MNRFLSFLAAGWLCTLPLHSQDSLVWSLRRCIDHAIEHNLSVKQMANTAEQNRNQLNTAKWARLPNLNGSVSQGWNWGRTQTAVKNDDTGNYSTEYIDMNSHSTSFSLSTNVPLFTGLSLPNQYQLARLNLEASLADLEKAKEDIALQVTSAYMQVLFNRELTLVARQQVELSREQSERLARLCQTGKAAPSEAAEAEAQLAQDRLSAVQADNNYQLSVLELSQLLELPTPEGFEPEAPDTALSFGPLTPPDEIYRTALQIKPAIQAAELRLEGSRKNIRIAQSGYYPQLNLGAGLSTNYYSTIERTFRQQMNDNYGKYIGISLSVPIFNRLEVRNRVRNARLQQIGYSLELDERKKTLYKEIQQAWYNARASETQYQSSTAAVKASDSSFALTQKKFTNGQATFLEYNEARLKRLKALSDQLKAKYEYLFRTKILNFYKGEPIA